MEYDVLRDEVVGPHSQMQVVMAREMLLNIIEKLDQIGFKTICCVSHCSGGYVGLWRALDISYENPVFSIPNQREIIYVPDAPHIFKLIRNWLLDIGFEYNDQTINKKPLEFLINITSTELSICPQRQKVRLASQLLFHTTSTALLHCHNILKENKRLIENLANFIELVNNWFDVVNASHPNDNNTQHKQPYDNNKEEQNLKLNKITVKGFTAKRVKVFLSSKINQDALGNLFSQLRSRGGLNDHPSPLNALFRIHLIILGSFSDKISVITDIGASQSECFEQNMCCK
ncbi:hypothetical protein AGLY_002003 [Aphis glycines]|uniref:Transposable element P transposase-like GTP-binding insertion domain-containing protein n=1 Tax=Aphis glycines TaxID=307491 RepID=A0A6G0U4A6_APHGL|nr:hypothetical protein AGLY_002003 [Aphis glycines]